MHWKCAFLLGTCDHHQRSAEIGLRVSGRMRQWHEFGQLCLWEVYKVEL
jgi:hypothetical protein